MKFTQLLDESYWKTVKPKREYTMVRANSVELFKNPTPSEIISIIRTEHHENDIYAVPSVRIAVYENGDVYVWDGNIFHKSVEKYIPKKYYGMYYDASHPFLVQTDSISNKEWDNFKNQKVILDKLKKMFPKAKQLEIKMELYPLNL